VTIADRFETMATAVAASYMNIPLLHIQGGEVTGSIDEKVRHAITKLADLHFVASAKAAERVIRMGERPEAVFVTGCPSIDVAREAITKPSLELASIYQKYGGVGQQMDLSSGYIVVLQHPVTTEYQSSRAHVEETLCACRDCGHPVLWFWPNVDAGSDGTSKGIRAFREESKNLPIHFFKNFPPEEFLQLLQASRCIVGNSSVAIRECSYLGVPAVNIGSRQQGRDRGQNVVDVDYDREAILKAIGLQGSKAHREQDLLYGDGMAGQKIADLLTAVPLTVQKRLTYD
jgi:UDP-hydrolysing UDP-N-acetyl-D-glucosamine 2-epimerase